MREPGDRISRKAVEHRATAVPLLVGIAVVILGLAVIVASHADLPLLIQLYPTFAPLRYNTALPVLGRSIAGTPPECPASRSALGSRRRCGGVAHAGGVCLQFRSRNRPIVVPFSYLHPDFASRKDVVGRRACLPHGGSGVDLGGRATPAPAGNCGNRAPGLAGRRSEFDGPSRLRDRPDRHVWLGHSAGRSRSIATAGVPEPPSPSNYRLSLP
jgi:hypothetical protein